MDINSTDASSISVSPSFGSSATFSSFNDSITYGDNYSQIMSKGINALNMTLNLQFTQLTDTESQDLISFLQKQFYYEPQTYSSTGKFTNKRINPFNFLPFYPYKQNSFHCFAFNHSKQHYNINAVSAQLKSASASILNSVESGAGHNSIIDAKINANLNSSSSVSDNDVNLPAGSVIFEDGAYTTAYLDSNFVVNKNSSSTLQATSSVGFSNGQVSVNQTPLRHSIFIDDPNECFYYPYEPIHDNEALNVRMFDFRPVNIVDISHNPKYKQSTITDFYTQYNLYGFNPNLLKINLKFELLSDLEAKRILLFLESHLGSQKFGFHLQKDYSQKHDGSDNYSPHNKNVSYFICPEWTHTFNFKNNHSISANFVECVRY